MTVLIQPFCYSAIAVSIFLSAASPSSFASSFSHDSRYLTWSRSCDTTELEAIFIYDTKEADAAKMADELSAQTRDAVRAEVMSRSGLRADYHPRITMKIPKWLRSEQ